MQIKTITTAAGVNEIDFGNDDSQTTAHFYWFKNLSDSTLYVSAMPTPVAGEDNVAELSAKGAASVETDEGKVYVLGAGKVEVHRTNSKFCPFELPSSGSGGSGSSSQIIKNVRLNGNTSANGFIVTDLPADSIDILSVLCMSPDYVYAEAWALESTGKWCISFYDTNSGALLKKNLDVTYEISYVDKSEAGGGGYIAIDSELSETSVNPLQNKATTAAINEVKSDLVKTQKDVAENAAALSTKSDINHIHDITASGNPVTLTNLQGEVPFSEITVSGKNLISIAQAKALTGDNTNGYFVVDNASSRIFIQKLSPNTAYCIKKYDEGNRFRIVLFDNEPSTVPDKTAKQLVYSSDGSVTEHAFTTGTDYLWLVFTTHYAESGDAVEPIVQLELGDTATAYEPPITSQEVTITRCGKNLLNVYIPTKREYVVNNTTFTINDDGSVTAVSAETETAATRLSLSMTCPPGDYMFSGSADKDFCTYIYNHTKNTVTAWANPNPVPCRIEKENEYVLYFMVRENGKANGNVCKPQLELGETVTEYEPYQADTISITPTSNPYTIQNDLLQYDDINTLIVSIGELKVVGVQENAAVKKVWDEITEVEHNANSMQSEITALGNVNAEGALVVMDNLQGKIPFSEITILGKNLFDYRISAVPAGITVTALDDGSLKVSGKMEISGSAWGINLIAKSSLPKGETYTLSINPDVIGILPISVYYIGSAKEKQTFVWNRDEYFTVSLNIQPNVDYDFVFRPQLEIGTEATAYEPPITSRDLTVGVCGKNLLKYPYAQTTRTSYGVTFTDNGDGSITASGTHDGGTKYSYFGFTPWWNDGSHDRIFIKKETIITYRVLGLPDNFISFIYVFTLNDGGGTLHRATVKGENTITYTATEDCYVACGIQGDTDSIGQSVDFTCYPQLEIGSTATPYEPYHGSVTTITPDSNPYIIPNDIRQQDGLNNISVSSGVLSVAGMQRNAAIKKIWDKFTSIDNDIVDLYFKISTLESNTSASIEANGQEIEAVRNTLDSIRDELTSVTDDVTSNTSRIDNLDAANMTLGNDIETLRAENEALHTEIAELRALIETT